MGGPNNNKIRKSHFAQLPSITVLDVGGFYYSPSRDNPTGCCVLLCDVLEKQLFSLSLSQTFTPTDSGGIQRV